MIKLRWLPVLAVLLLLLLVVTAPARLLGYWVAPQAVSLSGFSGTIWNGRAAAAAVPLAGGVLQLGELEWRLRPWSLLLLSPRVKVTTRWGQQRIDAEISVGVSGTIKLRDAVITVPAEIAKHWFPVQLQGNLTLRTEYLVLEDSRPTAGDGALVWQQAAWSAGGAVGRLGDYALEFQVVAPGQVESTILTLSGPIEVAGTANLYPDRYTVDARLSSPDALSPGLSNALRLFAAPTASGFHIKLDTPIP
ncbi:type II secretion system protein N [Halieaceae bacterium IMCC14734]|uniref:Type II secretion system protein N n=1 Tax=Candidatus Litorirhabdus singularis TaxID=2518993 RepID=A0ABT3TFH8_9GAMM|nr:type II secretion system protein N [Candidatus Litorirhabdus singularis]MCX2981051.1 type II secretion system protein N [Candidatus Litorirhabdus singularis]